MARLAPDLPVAVVLVEPQVGTGFLPEEVPTVVEGPEGRPVVVTHAISAQVVQFVSSGPATRAHSPQLARGINNEPLY